MMPRGVWGEAGVTVVPVLVVVLVVSAIGIGLVGVMNTDITHATIQGAVSRSYFVTQAGLEDAVVQLKANALFRTAPYPAVVGAQNFGGGQFWVWVEDYAEDMVQITSRGRATTAGRTVTSEVRAIALVGPPITFGLFGVSTVGAQGANSRTYLAPWQTAGPGVPRGPNMGSFLDINFQDNGTRLNAISETSPDTVTLRDGTFDDWELYGFTSRPVYATDPSVDPTPWILAAFGDIVKAQPDTGGWAHSCSPLTYYACLTVQNGSLDVSTITSLRLTENVRHVYMNRIRRRILPVTSLASAPILQEAQANNGNLVVNQAAGITNTPNDSIYAADEFHCLLEYLNNNPGQVIRGTIYVIGSAQIGGNINVACGGGQRRNRALEDDLNILDGTLAVEGDLTLSQNASLTIRHDILNPNPVVAAAAREKIALALFPRGNSTGRFTMNGGSQSKFTADGLVYTSEGMEVGPQSLVDLIGAMYHNTANNLRASFINNNGTTVIRYDPLAGTRLGSASEIGVKILSWQQLR